MRSIADTIDRLRRFSPSVAGRPRDAARLVPFTDFGRNPGDLDALIHVPGDLPPDSPLVVVLHGCTQTAEGYDHGSGWSDLADACGFAVLYAQQKRANNPNLCFNWFSAADTRRGGGEAESIRQMVAAMVERNGLDAARVFVTGLSAGGAMASVMLATSPEMFAAGAIIAGLPYGVAGTIPEAFDRMRGHGYDRAGLSALVRAASAHPGPWPVVSVWQGGADHTVDKANAALIVDQWRGIHDAGAPVVTSLPGGHQHRAWHDADGRMVIEEYAIAGMAHGTPLATTGSEAYGAPGPYMLDAGISSTYRIAASWGIAPLVAPAMPEEAVQAGAAAPRPTPAALFDPTATINEALRAAGLMPR